MRIINPLNHVKAHPEMYLSGVFSLEVELTAKLIDMQAHVADCRWLAGVRSGWHYYLSSIDWIDVMDHDASRLFQNVVADPESGVNSIRPEVIITAYSKELIVATDREVDYFHGLDHPDTRVLEELSELMPYRRAVLFKCV